MRSPTVTLPPGACPLPEMPLLARRLARRRATHGRVPQSNTRDGWVRVTMISTLWWNSSSKTSDRW